MMMRFTNQWRLRLAVSAALLLGAVATSHAQGMAAQGTPIVTGGGHWVALDNNGAVAGTAFSTVSVVQLPDGTISGQGAGEFHTVDGVNMGIKFVVVDIVPVGDELFVISRITQTQGVPLGSPVVVGAWALLAIQDNGSGQGSPDKATSFAGVPAMFSLDFIKDVILPGAPEPDDWFPLVGGNFTIH